MYGMDRRDFAITAAASLGLLQRASRMPFLGLSPKQQPGPYIRRNVYCLSATSPELRAYKARDRRHARAAGHRSRDLRLVPSTGRAVPQAANASAPGSTCASSSRRRTRLSRSARAASASIDWLEGIKLSIWFWIGSHADYEAMLRRR
jgi:hypothetical protein